MEIVIRVAGLENYQNFSVVIAERPKLASKNSEPIYLGDCVSGTAS